MSRLSRLVAELRRRRVLNAALAYLVAAFGLLQGVQVVVEAYELPRWVLTALVTAAVAGFPVAVALAWFFDLVPDRPATRPGDDAGEAPPPPAPRSGWARRPRWLVVAGLAVIATGLTAWRVARARAEPAVQSLAVLPLANLSGDPGQAYFADGITDALITQLARIPGLRVVSRTSSLALRGSQRPLGEVGALLHVDAVVEGAVARDGNRVRISVKLVDVRRDQALWAEDYDRALADVLSVQEEVARGVARRVRAVVAPGEAGRPGRSGAVDPQAYDAYLRGRALWANRGRDSLLAAVQHFQRAVELDPGFAEAWSGLADAYTALGYESHWDPAEAFPKGKEAAERALERDPELAEAHASLGYVKLYYDWDFDGAEAEFKRAIAANPSYGTAHHWYSVFLTARGRPAEAAEHIRLARELDPLSAPIASDMGFELYYAGAYGNAIAQLQAVLRDDPAFDPARLWLGRALEQEGRYDEAIATFRGARTLQRFPVLLAALGHACGQAGRTAEAEEVLAQLEALSKDTFVTPYGIALVHAGLGHDDEALAWLRKAYQGRSHWLVWMRLDPRWGRLRQDPRFEAIARAVGL